jgi:hypothetical protein
MGITSEATVVDEIFRQAKWFSFLHFKEHYCGCGTATF